MPTPEAAQRARRRCAALLLGAAAWFVTTLALAADPPSAMDVPAQAAPPLGVLEASEAPRIGLVTMEPGQEYWSRYGHNAILVDDGIRRTLYNYGYFDFSQPRFLTRFLRGRMLYRLLALPMEEDLANYAAEGRGAVLQWLALEPGAARGLADHLAWNARPENADYRYDYFTANCSTKVRDALDGAFGGALRRELSGRSHGYTFRDEARRLAATLPWLYLGTHLGLGPYTDRPVSLWEESFVPMRLRDALAQTRIGGRPVVARQVPLLPHRLVSPPDAPPQWRWRFATAGLATAALLGWTTRRRAPRASRLAGAILAGLLWLVCGLAGAGLLALWGLTDHVAAWGNENALLFDPLCLGLLAALPALARGGEAPRALRVLALAVLGAAGVALFLKFLPFRLQANGDWIVLLLPVHAALAWRLARIPPPR
jgi:hypothetical protein